MKLRRSYRAKPVVCRFLGPVAFAVKPSVRKQTTQLIERKNMKKIRILSLATMLVAGSFAGTAQANHCTTHNDIVAVASSAGSFNTLVAAVKAAGLVETLQGPGPFTVFAPTDEAFAKLPPGTVENLLKPENKEQLVAVLTYHVLPGKVTSKEVETTMAKTVNGKAVSLKVSGSSVMVDGATVIKADVPASNGVIHVIDTVILPQ